MDTITVSAANVVDGTYTGPDVSAFAGHLEFAPYIGIVRFHSALKVSVSIIAGAGSGIKAGHGIKAGLGIEAGSGIEAGWGIKAGFSIRSRWISCALRIFAGTVNWRQPTLEETHIYGEIRSGIVAIGMVIAEATSEPRQGLSDECHGSL